MAPGSICGNSVPTACLLSMAERWGLVKCERPPETLMLRGKGIQKGQVG